MRLTETHPAVIEGKSIHWKRTKDPYTYKGNVLKSVRDNTKLGNGSDLIVKGKWSGMPMFSLTLEERATCPKSCHHWRDCYGNNMGFAHRFQHGKALELKLSMELDKLAEKYRNGFVVRLHVLGDFYSEEYAQLWAAKLRRYPNLHVFGYTARPSGDPIRAEIALMNLVFRDRCWIRLSQKVDTGSQLLAIETPSSNAITCPQQTGKTEACVTCGLCWSVSKPIHFLTH